MFFVKFAPNKYQKFMKRCFLTVVFCAIVLSAWTDGPKRSVLYEAYIEQYKDLAIEEMLRYGVPASITLAQGILESGGGSSELAVKGNNHFGIKCHGWSGRKVYHDDDAHGECFRAYDHPRESFEDHSKFLRNGSRYSKLFTLDRTDYQGWARGLKAAGYATSPTYAQRLIGIIELYNLDQYDRATHYDKFVSKHNSTDTPAVKGADVHIIRSFNKNYYLYARSGDTFRNLAKEVGISEKKLARYNERDRNDVLAEGDIIYLKKKRSRASKDYKNCPHVVGENESMYLVSQLYGIRLKKLYKMNGLTPDYQLKVGDRLRVY